MACLTQASISEEVARGGIDIAFFDGGTEKQFIGNYRVEVIQDKNGQITAER